MICQGNGLVPADGTRVRSLSHNPTSPTTKAPEYQGFRTKRLKGLEPSTFCMASRRSSQLSYSRTVKDHSFRRSGHDGPGDSGQVSVPPALAPSRTTTSSAPSRTCVRVRSAPPRARLRRAVHPRLRAGERRPLHAVDAALAILRPLRPVAAAVRPDRGEVRIDGAVA